MNASEAQDCYEKMKADPFGGLSVFDFGNTKLFHIEVDGEAQLYMKEGDGDFTLVPPFKGKV